MGNAVKFMISILSVLNNVPEIHTRKVIDVNATRAGIIDMESVEKLRLAGAEMEASV